MKKLHRCIVMMTLLLPETVFGDQSPAIHDKTLVVWAAPANLTQRGGSALTIDDMRSHFDGIVFGERDEQKWMAGSDGFRRTQKDQSAYQAESTGPDNFVRMAIVYRDRQVTIYRNDQIYAEFTMENPPQTFGSGSVVMMGKRHIATQDERKFAGAIDDARVYDVPLSAEQIAALEPNRASHPQPAAWWSFERVGQAMKLADFPTRCCWGARESPMANFIWTAKVRRSSPRPPVLAGGRLSRQP